jgi:hypothetical protein
MTRSTKIVATASTPTVVLKTVHDAIIKANPTSKLTTKDMRTKLRANKDMLAIHTRFASWIFTPAQADACRAMFDAPFAARLAAQAKRASRPAKAKKVAVIADAND